MTVFLDLACLIPLMLKTNFSLHLKYSVSFIFSQYVSFIFVIMPIYALFICAFTCFYMYILIDFDCFIQTKHFFNHLKFCKKIKTIITNRLSVQKKPNYRFLHAVRLRESEINFVFCEWELYDGTASEQKTESAKKRLEHYVQATFL